MEITNVYTAPDGRVFRVGDEIKFNTNSNLGVRTDTIRGCFMQYTLGEVELRPALILTNHSWCFVDDVLP